MLDRRAFLGTAAALLPARTATEPFRHRGYLGWITDLATRPDTCADWPSMRIDGALVRDYERTFTLMQRLGYNEITVWGFYVARSWPVDIASAVSPERGRLVERILRAAHRQGIRVYSGLGVYSWGFDEIIKANPHLANGNPHAMCPGVPDSWKWMQRVVDYVFTRFPIDGVSMQSADQGRCPCEECKPLTDAEYHSRLNIRVAEYIRAAYPGKTVAANGWGMRLGDARSPESVDRLSEHVDYIVDALDTARAGNPAQRARLIRGARCPFGTIGGPQVEPPQHWPRDRWLLPTVRQQGEHLAELYREGGRACEYFFHILANSGCEISFWTTGKILSDPATPWRKHFRAALEEVYAPAGSAFVGDLEELFLEAEDTYFSRCASVRSGTISLEPLVSNRPGKPVYLEKIKPGERAACRTHLAALQTRASRLAAAAPHAGAARRLRFSARALGNAIRDLDNLSA